MANRSRVIITGASGGIGRDVTRAFLNAGHSVVALFHQRDIPFRHPNMTVIQTDLRDAQGTQDSLAGFAQTPGSVFHLAHNMNYGQGDYKAADVQAANPSMFRNLAAALGPDHHYVLMSSVSVYGYVTAPVTLTPERPIGPYDGYTNAKAEMEKDAKALNAHIVRCCRIIAEGCNISVNGMIKSALDDKHVPVHVDRKGGTLTSSFARSVFMGQLLLSIHERPAAIPKIVTPSETVLSLGEIAQFIARKTGATFDPRQTDEAPHFSIMADNTGLSAMTDKNVFLKRAVGALIPV